MILDELVAENEELVADNKELAKLKLRGKRYPTYDIASPTLIASVKTHYGAGGVYTEEHIRAYVGDFGRMLGFNRGI